MSHRKRKDDVWEKGDLIKGKDPDLYRLDPCGNVIYYHSFGKDTDMGWNIDHSKPKALGGTDHLNNLQPMQSSQNKSKSDNYPYDYDEVEQRGKTRNDLVEIEFDKRSPLIRNGDLMFNYDGTVDQRSAAVKNGQVRVNGDGSVNLNSKALNNGSLF
jgi:hypothetical protein